MSEKQNLQMTPAQKRPPWIQALLWAMLAVFAGLLIRELSKIFSAWRR